MKLSWYGGAALAVVMTAGAAHPNGIQDEPQLAIHTVRYYRGGGQGATPQTAVDVFCRVPLLMVNPIGVGGGGGAFRFSVLVRDSAGLQLASYSRLEQVPAEVMRTRGASTVEQFAFAAHPGRYTIEVTVTDSATGRVERRQEPLEAFGQAPGASDLLLASGIRRFEDDTVLRVGEVKKAQLVLTTSGRPVLTPSDTLLGYYIELYPPRAETTMVAVRVVSDSGKQMVAVPPSPLAVGAGGRFTYGALNMSGLPPGSYQLEVSATGPDFQVKRVSGFGMADMKTVETRTALSAAEEWPGGLTEAQMDSAYAPLDYLMDGSERGQYSTLSVDGKRNWLKRFWAKRDPTRGTPRNEAREQWEANIKEANRQFVEGGSSGRPGWSTDRGKIFMKMGRADQIITRKVPQSGMPYEVWRYTRSRLYTYVFMDLTRFGNWTLIYTNDPREVSRPGWDQLLGPDALRDLEQQ